MYRTEFSNNEKQKTVLFEEKEFSEIQKNARESLRLMANCVILTNATILKERNLVPEKFFHEYPVYGNVKGYAVNRETPEGQKLAEKLEACLEPIQDRVLHKLALVVEETLHTQPVEAFIWNFSYDSISMDASAEIGYGSQRSKFTVNYKNMQDTCQQFCKLFSKLQDILTDLQPLPEGMVPSMRIAFRGDPEFVPGFYSINEFVSLEQVHHFDVVPFPHNGLQLSFASQFRNELCAPPFVDTYEPAYISTTVAHSISDEQIEAPRHDTMGNENNMAGENLEEADIQFDDFIDVSMNCNPNNVTNSDERRVLRSEFEMAGNDIPQNESFEKSPRKEAETPKMTAEKRRVATDDLNIKDQLEKTKKRKDSVNSGQDYLKSVEVPEKKKCARRLIQTDDEITKPENVPILENDRVVPGNESPVIRISEEKEDTNVQKVKPKAKPVQRNRNTRRSTRNATKELYVDKEIPPSKLEGRANKPRADDSKPRKETLASKSKKSSSRLSTSTLSLGDEIPIESNDHGAENSNREEEMLVSRPKNRSAALADVESGPEEEILISKSEKLVISEQKVMDDSKIGEVIQIQHSSIFGRVRSLSSLISTPPPPSEKSDSSQKQNSKNGQKYGKTAVMNLSEPQKDNDTGNDDKPTHTNPQNFARVPSILSILEEPASVTGPPIRPPKINTTRYGRVSSVLDIIEPVNVEFQNVPIERAQKYGRVRSLKAIQQSKIYGQTYSLVKEK
ncbi:unnamed protein product [Caenorhabditis brenneri]